MALRHALQVLFISTTVIVLVWVTFGLAGGGGKHNKTKHRPPPDVLPIRKQPSKIWIAMSVCFDADDDSVAYTAMLWRRLTGYGVIVNVIYDPEAEDLQKMPEMVSQIQRGASRVSLIPAENCTNSVAVLQNFLSYKFEEVGGNDVIVSASPRIFPMIPDVLGPYIELDYRVWIYGYRQTKRKGTPFQTNLMGLESSLLRRLLNDSVSLEELISMSSAFSSSSVLENGNDGPLLSTDTDLFLTGLILSNGLCDLPKRLWNKMLKKTGLTRPSVEAPAAAASFAGDDGGRRCFKGDSRWSAPCGRDSSTRGSGCRLWELGKEEMPRDKYDEILRINSNLG